MKEWNIFSIVLEIPWVGLEWVVEDVRLDYVCYEGPRIRNDWILLLTGCLKNLGVKIYYRIVTFFS